MDSNKPRHQIYFAQALGAQLGFTLVGEAYTRREALKIRQDTRSRSDKNKTTGTVYLYTDGRLDKIGVHR